jgi:hypothetical protein
MNAVSQLAAYYKAIGTPTEVSARQQFTDHCAGSACTNAVDTLVSGLLATAAFGCDLL